MFSCRSITNAAKRWKILGAEVALGQRMYIGEEAAEKLIQQYFKIK